MSELFLPGPNEFIPTNLTVDKKPVEKVRSCAGNVGRLGSHGYLVARSASDAHPIHSSVDFVAQEG